MVLDQPWQGTTHLPATGPVLRVADARTTENVSPHVQAGEGSEPSRVPVVPLKATSA